MYIYKLCMIFSNIKFKFIDLYEYIILMEI